MTTSDETRRRFMSYFAGIGLGSSLVPGIIWARMQDQGTQRVTLAMVKGAMQMQGIDLPDADLQSMVGGANGDLERYEIVRKTHIPLDVSPPVHFSPLAPGIVVDRGRRPIRLSAAPAVSRPANLEDLAFWPVRHLAHLVRTRQLKSLELTQMYLERLHRYNPKLNFVVTFLDDLALAQAKQADAEIAAGTYRGPLHGIPWGAKDIIAVKGYPTTWGAAPLKNQVFDYDASVVEMLRDAGAVLLAKLSTGQLAGGDQWFGGRTFGPWDPLRGSGGSSAGPSSATAAGCVAFGIGTETNGSILSPAARCGLASLKPTFGRVSRHGVMLGAWTLDRVGPMVRYAEDAALVMQVIAKPDGRDMSVSDIPFNWDARLDLKKLRVGYIKESFDGLVNPPARENAAKLLETLRALGVKELIPMTIPALKWPMEATNLEGFTYLDEMRRAGKLAGTSAAGTESRPSARFMPAVEYLQQQRLRMMMMTELATATKDLDVYMVAAQPTLPGLAPERRAALAAGIPAAPPPAPAEPAVILSYEGRLARLGPVARHDLMANDAGYPAINVPTGFTNAITPTHVTFFARPFAEEPLIALAKAYQDVAKHHLVKPRIE